MPSIPGGYTLKCSRPTYQPLYNATRQPNIAFQSLLNCTKLKYKNVCNPSLHPVFKNSAYIYPKPPKMKKLILLFLASTLLLNACKKKEDTDPTPTTPTIPYYFKANLGGSLHNLSADIPQYMPFYANEVGGYQVADASLWPAFGLRLTWPLDDTVTESDLMGLIGKTLYFSDTLIHPKLTYGTSPTAEEWISRDISSPDNSVKITNVTFLKKDTTAGVYIKAYVIKGTCTASMALGSAVSNLSGGEFNFIISRRDF